MPRLQKQPQPVQQSLRWPLRHCRATSGAQRRPNILVGAGAKEIWLQTSDKATFTAALDSCAVSAFVFGPDPAQRALATAWSALAHFRSLLQDEKGRLRDAGTGLLVGEVLAVDGPGAARALEERVWRRRASPSPADSGSPAAAGAAMRQLDWAVVMDARDWKIIPAENLVALAQNPLSGSGFGSGYDRPFSDLQLLATAGSVEEARLMLEALQAGTGGVLLRTDDPAQVRALVSYVSRRAAEESGDPDAALSYEVARVVSVRPLGLGDRACVDLAGLMQPGEGLLVGSFARCLALVHSECGESDYIASRPFRVNAGPVHAYVSVPGGRTRYLSELASGAEVRVADPAGRTRTALVGRVKIERRPLVLVELETRSDGQRHSLMLQNAETVKLVGPASGNGNGDSVALLSPPSQVAPPAVQPRCASEAARTSIAASITNAIAPNSPPRGQQQQKEHQNQNQQQRQQPAGGGGVGVPGGADREGGGGGALVGSSAAGVVSGGIRTGRDSVGVGGWRAISVASLQPGDRLYVLLQPPARHTGIAVEEFIVEK